MDKFDFEVLGMGTNSSGFPGAFTGVVKRIIEATISGKVLHLYSGSSLIGDVRVDLEHPNATHHCRVEEFIKLDVREWDFCVLDPPYAITQISKLSKYAERASLSSNVVWRNYIRDYFKGYCKNIVWLDFCAPMVEGFKRKKLWLLLPGGFHTVRVLSWLTKGE